MAYDGLGASAAAAAASSRSCAEPLAEWPRNSRVAANSPSLWPTMFSVMYGDELVPVVHRERVAHEVGRDRGAPRPGLEHLLLVLVVQGLDLHHERRLHVRPLLHAASHYCVAFPRLRPRTMSLVDGFFLCRVFFPSTLPHGFVGGRPPDVLPSPPPNGWSTGFIATPRTRGMRPSQRLLPALPIDKSSCSAFDTSPIVARHSPRTIRISVERSRSVT